MLTGKTSQTSVSQTSIFLHVFQFLHVQTQLQRTTEPEQLSSPNPLLINEGALLKDIKRFCPTWYVASSQAFSSARFTMVF